MHNDARTGTAIALTAAMKGATIANYVEMTGAAHRRHAAPPAPFFLFHGGRVVFPF